MTKRKFLSKKLRFEIFKRDEFTCQYCGSHPPKCILHIDHINPIKLGGDNSQDNLITSCSLCNSGKSATPLSSIPESMSEKAKRIKESEAQIKEYSKIVNLKRERINNESWMVSDLYIERTRTSNSDGSIRKDYFSSIQRFIEKIGYFEVLDAMELACSKRISDSQVFKYFCGVCWNKISEAKNG